MAAKRLSNDIPFIADESTDASQMSEESAGGLINTRDTSPRKIRAQGAGAAAGGGNAIDGMAGFDSEDNTIPYAGDGPFSNCSERQARVTEGVMPAGFPDTEEISESGFLENNNVFDRQ
jgi:hypothetical protein